MSAPGKWDTHQQLRAKALAAKEASKIVSKPPSPKVNPILVEESEKVTEAKIEALAEVVTETAKSKEEAVVEVEVAEEAKVELKPISKKNKTKE